jgi:hypothetical protein
LNNQQQQPPTLNNQQQQPPTLNNQQQQPPTLNNETTGVTVPPITNKSPTQGMFPPFQLPSLFP